MSAIDSVGAVGVGLGAAGQLVDAGRAVDVGTGNRLAQRRGFPTGSRGGFVRSVNAAVSRDAMTRRAAAVYASRWETSCSSNSGSVCHASWCASSGEHEKWILLLALADNASWVRAAAGSSWCGGSVPGHAAATAGTRRGTGGVLAGAVAGVMLAARAAARRALRRFASAAAEQVCRVSQSNSPDAIAATSRSTPR